MERLVIIDYTACSVHFYHVDSTANIDEEYISNLGYSPSGCSWMSGEDIDIQFHKGILK